MTILDGKLTSARLLANVRAEVETRVAEGKRPPHLVVVLVGDDPASVTYVEYKCQSAREVGFCATLLHLPESTAESTLLQHLQRLNEDDSVDGYIVQLPLPSHIEEQHVISCINPQKDVDGFHPMNIGRVVQGLPAFVSATPLGILNLLDAYRVPVKGKCCVMLGLDNIVGRPLANILSSPEMGCTVTFLHNFMPGMEEYIRRADIVITALNRPEFLQPKMVKDGVTIVDVGMSRLSADNEKGYRVVGDVCFDKVAPKCSFISPVPGGVGPMTICSLLQNTLKAACEFGGEKR